MPPSAASERARCPGKGSTVDSKFTVDPAGGEIGAGAADQTQNSAAASTNATSSEEWAPVNQEGPAEEAPQPLKKGEKYRVEYPEYHPHDTGLENEGHPRLRAADDADIRRCFEQQFTEGMADHVLNCSNNPTRDFTTVTNKKLWRFFERGELYCLLGIVMFMGLVKLPSKEDYWDSGALGVQTCVPDYMSLRRFNVLTHEMLTTMESKEAQPLKTAPDYDKLWRIRPFLDLFKTAISSTYSLGRFVSVDEMMIKFKGRAPIKCYMPKKPTKWGIKVWGLCCSTLGYLWAFNVYVGADRTATPDKDAKIGEKIVINLTQSLPVCTLIPPPEYFARTECVRTQDSAGGTDGSSGFAVGADRGHIFVPTVNLLPATVTTANYIGNARRHTPTA